MPYIPVNIRRSVKLRQNGKCCCCIEKGQEFHHVQPNALSKHPANHFENNIVFLCENHHKLLHLGDPDTFQTIYEYVWYLYYKELPSIPMIEVASQVKDLLNKEFLKKKELYENYYI